MKALKTIAAGTFLVFTMNLLAGLALATPGPQSKKQPAKQQEKVYIPKEVKAIMQEGLATREGRQDIPFNIFKHLMFPAQENVFAIFFFKAKNKDLGFAPPTQAVVTLGEEAEPAPEAGVLVANLYAFLQFLQTDKGGNARVYREVYIPWTVEEDAAAFDPDKEEWYSFGYPLPHGKYTLAMALTSTDLMTVGVGYQDFHLPGPADYKDRLETTPLFFVKSMEQIVEPEMRTLIHKGLFTYSVLNIVPNLEAAVAPGQTVDLFYFIFGAASKQEAGQPPKSNIEAHYEILDHEGKLAIRWEEQNYDFFLVNQQLPLRQTVLIKDDEGERTEQRDLPAGTYTMIVTLKDRTSGAETKKELPFEVK